MMDNRDHDIDPVTGQRRSDAPIGTTTHDRDRRRGWLPWLLAALAVLILLGLLTRGCDDTANRAAVVPDTGTTVNANGGGVNTGDPTVASSAYRTADFDSYLAGNEPVGRAFALDRVTFASGSDTLDGAGRAEVAELAGVLKRYPRAAIALTGYADPAGDAAANQALSQRRAEAVRAALGEAGATASNVTLAAQGETGAAAVRANRKVEVRVTAR